MAAIKKLEVTARLGEAFTIESTLGSHTVYVDQPKGSGGADKGPSPLQYLFLALAGCIGSIGRIVANQQKLPVRGMEITVSGELDAEVLIGKSSVGRSGFTGIRAAARIDADMTDQEKRSFLREVDRRCPVSNNLGAVTPLVVELAE